MHLLEVALLAEVAAAIARRHRRRRIGRRARQPAERPLGQLDELVVLDLAGGRQHHAARRA